MPSATVQSDAFLEGNSVTAISVNSSYTTHLMGDVSSADQMPGETSTGTVKQSPTATWSDSCFTDAQAAQPEVAQMPKPEVAQKPFIVQQLTALAPYSHIRAGSGVIVEPSEGHVDEGQIPATWHHRKPEIAGRS